MTQEPLDNIVPIFDGCSDGLPKNPLRVVQLEEFAVLTDSDWHIKHVLPKAELIVMYGAPGSGKTFGALDMVMSIARGIEWNGNKVKQGRVIYICAEGAGGFRKRVIAYTRHHNLEFDDLPNFGVIANAPNFLNHTDATVISGFIGKADIIVIDTLSRIMAGGDENNSKDMGNMIAKCQALCRTTGATVILIHHSGKNVENGSRGWSGLLGAADAEFLVEKFPAGHKLTNTKQKDGELYPPIGFNLTQIVLGQDEDGENITSCTFELCDAPKTLDKDKKLGTTEELVVTAFKEFQSFSVPFEELIDRVIKNIGYDSTGGKRDRRRDMVKQAIASLQSKKLYSVTNNLVHKA